MSFDRIILYLCLVLLLLIPTVYIAVWAWKNLVEKIGRLGSLIFLVVSCLMVFAAHPSAREKNNEQRVQFWSASADTVYLIDNGSYVTSNKVHIAFATRLLPDSAMIFLDYIPKGTEPTAENFRTFQAMPAAEWPRNVDFDFDNATDYKWVMYTTYTPGPAVHTNGVAVAEFLKAPKYDNVAAPKRSTIWKDGKQVWPLPDFIGSTVEEDK